MENKLIKDYLDYVCARFGIVDIVTLDWMENVLEDNTDFLMDNPTFSQIDEFILGELETLEN
jgi:hypothetical protein